MTHDSAKPATFPAPVELDVTAIKQFVGAGHSRAETAKKFNVSATTLHRRGIAFSRRPPKAIQPRLSDIDSMALEMAQFLLNCGGSFKGVSQACTLPVDYLKAWRLASQRPVGWPRLPDEKFAAVDEFIAKGLSQRQAAAQAGVSRRAWQIRRRKDSHRARDPAAGLPAPAA